MTDEEIAPRRDEEPPAAELDALREQIARLQDRMEGQELAAEFQERGLRIQEIQQRIKLRNRISAAALTAAGAMLAILVFGLWKLLWHIPWWQYLPILPHSLPVPQGYAIALVIAPIVSVTTIVVALLIGAFRQFKDDDGDKIDVSSLVAEAVRNMSGS